MLDEDLYNRRCQYPEGCRRRATCVPSVNSTQGGHWSATESNGTCSNGTRSKVATNGLQANQKDQLCEGGVGGNGTSKPERLQSDALFRALTNLETGENKTTSRIAHEDVRGASREDVCDVGQEGKGDYCHDSADEGMKRGARGGPSVSGRRMHFGADSGGDLSAGQGLPQDAQDGLDAGGRGDEMCAGAHKASREGLREDSFGEAFEEKAKGGRTLRGIGPMYCALHQVNLSVMERRKTVTLVPAV